jgi:hypothetical protein
MLIFESMVNNCPLTYVHSRSSLQDQDGASAWAPLDQPQYVGRSLLRPIDSSAYEIGSTYDLFKKLILDADGYNEIKTGKKTKLSVAKQSSV